MQDKHTGWEIFTEFGSKQNADSSNYIYIPDGEVNEVRKYTFIIGTKLPVGAIAAYIEIERTGIPFRFLVTDPLPIGRSIIFTGELITTFKEKIRLKLSDGITTNTMHFYACGFRCFLE